MPASIGTKIAIIDFEGESVSASEMQTAGYANRGVEAGSFFDLFSSSNMFLDMNADGVVNRTDGNLVRDAIMAKVNQDYAPYRITILATDMRSSIGLMTDSFVGDAFCIVTGGSNIVSSQSAFGVSPPALDTGNLKETLSFVFGGTVAGSSNSAADFINRMARTISHELGHGFGLDHIVTGVSGDAVKHHLMAVSNRDFNHDFTFMDLSFNTDSGMQNAHQILSQETVLGQSPNRWMAVLKPGELTVTLEDRADRGDHIIVTPTSMNLGWRVTGVLPAPMVVTRAAVDVTSMNPFNVSLTRLIVNGRAGNDLINIDATFANRVIADGGQGHDTITAGTGNDELRGGEGNDSIVAGSGNDSIFGGSGNDWLQGGFGNDTLSGGTGTDDLWGEQNNDRLDDGEDGSSDRLRGGTGADTFIQYAQEVWDPELHQWIWGDEEDDVLDATSLDTVLYG